MKKLTSTIVWEPLYRVLKDEEDGKEFFNFPELGGPYLVLFFDGSVSIEELEEADTEDGDCCLSFGGYPKEDIAGWAELPGSRDLAMKLKKVIDKHLEN